jgi:CheY-like chemotaxis protein
MPTSNTTAAPTILLVEDEENDVVFMKMAMEHAGITNALQVAEDGGEAVEYLSGNGEYADRLRHPLPALMLLDLKLPRVMGMDVLKWIRERREFDLMVVIVLTSSQQRSDIELAASLHANSYLVKPSNPLDLNELVALLKQYWLQLNQPTATLAIKAAAAAPR